MDGTVLDLHFDNYFWREHLPRRYAEKHTLDLESARADLLARYARVEGTLRWYCLDYWSRELGLEIVELKREVEHLISVHDHAWEFLTTLRKLGKRTVLLTNAHQKSLELKMRRTGLASHFDSLISSHSLGCAKEEIWFWPRLQAVEPHDPQRTLLVDDSLPVLKAARHYGIRYLWSVSRPDSRGPRRPIREFPVLENFRKMAPL